MSKEEKYKKCAMDILADYLDAERDVISEFSGDFRKSAEWLKKHTVRYLKRLDENEDVFYELIKGTWIADYYKEEKNEDSN